MSAPTRWTVQAVEGCMGENRVAIYADENGSFIRYDDFEKLRTDLSQAAVTAALEAAATTAAKHAKYTRVAVQVATAAEIMANLISVTQTKTANAIEDEIRALITPAQHDALAAHVAAEVAKARAEDAAKIEALVGVLTRTKQSLGFCAAEFMSLGGLSSEDEELIDQRLTEANAAIAQIGAKP